MISAAKLKLKAFVKNSPILTTIYRVLWHFKKLFTPHDGSDNSAYWRRRAREPGTKAVLWKNTFYNDCLRELEFDFLAPHIASLPLNGRVLDIGCGTGQLSDWIASQRGDLRITAVDFPEMIDRASSSFSGNNQIEWIADSAEAFVRESYFDLVISSGCYAAIRDIAKCKKAVTNGILSVKQQGKLIMIDPFHKWTYLARARMHAKEVQNLLQEKGLPVEFYSGMLFWPMREILANSQLNEDSTRKWFHHGERLLSIFGKKTWSDYKLMVFRKQRRSK